MPAAPTTAVAFRVDPDRIEGSLAWRRRAMAVSAASSLTLRALLFGAIDRARLDAGTAVVTGLTAAARALAIAADRAADRRRWSSCRRIATSRRCSATSASFSARSRGGAPSEAEQRVLPFPSHEVDPYRGLAPHLDVTSARALALHGLVAGVARVVVASAAALAAARQRPRSAADRRRRAQARRRDRSARPRRSARRRRLRARRSGRSARRVLCPRRPRRRVSAGRAPSVPHRVPRRHHRVDSPLRPVVAALGRDRRSRADRAAARDAAIVGRPPETTTRTQRSIAAPPCSTT